MTYVSRACSVGILYDVYFQVNNVVKINLLNLLNYISFECCVQHNDNVNACITRLRSIQLYTILYIKILFSILLFNENVISNMQFGACYKATMHHIIMFRTIF